jgi:hypothetical protein
MAIRAYPYTRTVSVFMLIWLLIGVAAAVQRGYLSGSDTNCGRVGSTIVTIVAGPLNYVGVNPRISCRAPQPSR